MRFDPDIFKSYDIRGIYGETLDEELAKKIAKGFAKYLDFPETVIVGRDGRVSGPSLHKSVIDTLVDLGINVIDVDLVSTDMYYFACKTKDLPGIMITASHNPKEYNGFKMVKKIPHLLSGDAGIGDIRDYIVNNDLPEAKPTKGKIEKWHLMPEFIDKIISMVSVDKFKNLTVYADTANGMVGPILKSLDKKLPTINFKPLYWDVDGNFPNHGGDPLDYQNRKELMHLMPDSGADVGVMFDPDGDRFFAIDKKGRFISGDFLTAIMSKYFLQKYPHSNIIYDIRASNVVNDTINEFGGKGFANRIGHTHIKARMEKEHAIFGGEVTGHYYFKDFYLCDTGVGAMMYFLEFLSTNDTSLEEIIDEMESNYHISGEINNQVKSVQATLDKLEKIYAPKAVKPVIKIDGITLEMGDWRFNVRGSNTQPLIRLNLEANSTELMQEKRDEVLKIITEDNV